MRDHVDAGLDGGGRALERGRGGWIICEVRDCEQKARFGLAKQRAPLRCAKHSNESHVVVLGYACSHPGCRKFPIYSNANTDRMEGRRRPPPERCSDHKGEGDVDVFNARCRHPGCFKHPTFAPPGSPSPLMCASHKLPDHASVRKKYHKLCRHPEGCVKSPVYGVKSTKQALFCKSHKHDSHVDILSARCQHKGGTGSDPCSKYASFGYPSKKPVYCVEHMRVGMVHVKSPPRHHPRPHKPPRGKESTVRHRPRRSRSAQQPPNPPSPAVNASS